ncbi:uncharacterized protein LOC108955528 [Eucalyptus grandis]|uniref:uncharacterized protein LOC108955528 n=1 Tax=Eucalyptus grandis TaxID=71139 RepID=UPI00192ED71A|nr:uncharacterized protein LOC108955528 [Eucalyptus grandis]
MAKDNGWSKYAEQSYYTPRIHVKRVYPWLTDVTRPGMSSNKRKAVEAALTSPNFMHRSVYPLYKASSYPLIRGQVQGELVSRPSQYPYMVDSSLGVGGMSAKRNGFKNARRGNASSHSHHFREILKTKFNRVHDSDNVMFAPISNFLGKADDGRLLRTVVCSKCYASFLSLGHPPQIKDGSNTPVDVSRRSRNEGLDLRLTLGRNYEENIVSSRADEEPKHASSTAIAYNRAIDEYPRYANLSGATSQMNIIKVNAYQNNTPMHVIHNGGCNVNQTLDCNDKHKRNVVVFGQVTVTANNEAILDNQNFAQSSRPASQVGTVEPKAHPFRESIMNLAVNPKKQKASRREKPKRTIQPHPNAFLSSVHNLLSTGIFDGAPVKYILSSRDIILRGVIKGPKILCSCNECNNSEYISPYKFEFHAGGRTKYPNEYIYFENGNTIYEVFQELKDTPEDMLFDAIPKIAGSAHHIQLPPERFSKTTQRTKFHQLRDINNLPEEES